MRVEGCTPPPAVSARITRLRSGRPTVRVTATAGTGAPALRELRVLLPEALRAKPRRARAGARARTGEGAVARTAIRLSRDGVLRLAPLPAATRTVTRDARQGRGPGGPPPPARAVSRDGSGWS